MHQNSDWNATLAEVGILDTEDPEILGLKYTSEQGQVEIGSELLANTDPGTNYATLKEEQLDLDAEDNIGLLQIDYNPPLGHQFSIGNHSFTITVTDTSGRTAEKTVTVRVTDNEPPTVICPPAVQEYNLTEDQASITVLVENVQPTDPTDNVDVDTTVTLRDDAPYATSFGPGTYAIKVKVLEFVK